jgi:hypothetical protein
MKNPLYMLHTAKASFKIQNSQKQRFCSEFLPERCESAGNKDFTTNIHRFAAKLHIHLDWCSFSCQLGQTSSKASGG